MTQLDDIRFVYGEHAERDDPGSSAVPSALRAEGLCKELGFGIQFKEPMRLFLSPYEPTHRRAALPPAARREAT